MKVCAVVQKGMNKKICEDSAMVGNGVISEGMIQWKPQPDEKIVLAVSDGVGGNPAGEVASFRVLKGIREAEFYTGCIPDYIFKALQRINDEILEDSRKHSEYDQMAATLSGIYQDADKCILFHVGNTRVYVVNSGGYLRQLTKDHTNVEVMVEMGRLTPEEAQLHPDRSQIYACMGGGTRDYMASLQVTDITEKVSDGRTVMLTTDGLHDFVSLDDMEEVLAQEQPIEQKLEQLVKLARDNGSEDDISVIYFERKEENAGEES